MHAPQSDTLIGRYFGRYHVTRKLGSGRMGGVYEVVQQSIGHRAAMSTNIRCSKPRWRGMSRARRR